MESGKKGTRISRAVVKFLYALGQAHVKFGVVTLLCQTIKQIRWPRHAAAHLLRRLCLGRYDYQASTHIKLALNINIYSSCLSNAPVAGDCGIHCSSEFLARRKYSIPTRRHSDH